METTIGFEVKGLGSLETEALRRQIGRTISTADRSVPVHFLTEDPKPSTQKHSSLAPNPPKIWTVQQSFSLGVVFWGMYGMMGAYLPILVKNCPASRLRHALQHDTRPCSP